MTYEELIEFISVDETVIICLSFDQRRTAVQALCDMGFVCNAGTMDYIEHSDSIGDMRFMNPGLLGGKISCFNSEYVDQSKCAEFGTFMNIIDGSHQAEEAESDEDFEARLKSLLCS